MLITACMHPSICELPRSRAQSIRIPLPNTLRIACISGYNQVATRQQRRWPPFLLSLINCSETRVYFCSIMC